MLAGPAISPSAPRGQRPVTTFNLHILMRGFYAESITINAAKIAYLFFTMLITTPEAASLIFSTLQDVVVGGSFDIEFLQAKSANFSISALLSAYGHNNL